MQTNRFEKLLLEAAVDSLGIYPQNIGDTEGVLHPRTEWQSGWNDAIIAIRKNQCAMIEWAKSIPAPSRDIVFELLDEGAAFLTVDKSEITLCLNMNDTFAYACADSEDVSFDDLLLIEELWRDYRHDGLTAWVAIKRQMEPLEQLRSAPYNRAYGDLLCG